MTASRSSPPRALSLFTRAQALRTGHFQLSSGLHSGQYVQCALVLKNPRTAAKLGKELAGLLPSGPRPDGVVSPAVGGILAGHEVARALGLDSVFAEREKDGKMAFRRGFALKRGGRYVAVEDVLTTGASTQELIQLVQSHGARVTAVLALVQRGTLKQNWKMPVRTLISLHIPTYAPDRCPLCREGLPVESPGSRRLRKS
jgi:orotate phosphoribosyltransferase